MDLPKQIHARGDFTCIDPDNPEKGLIFSYKDEQGLAVGSFELTEQELLSFTRNPMVFLNKLQVSLSATLDRNYPVDTLFSVNFEPTEIETKYKMTIEVES